LETRASVQPRRHHAAAAGWDTGDPLYAGTPVSLWNLATDGLVSTLHGQAHFSTRADSVAFSPDDRTLAEASDAGGADVPYAGIQLWDLADGTAATLTATGGGAVAFSPDGKTLAIPDGDTIQLWSTGALPATTTPSPIPIQRTPVPAPTALPVLYNLGGALAAVWNNPQVKPVVFYIFADGSAAIGGMRWARWNDATAVTSSATYYDRSGACCTKSDQHYYKVTVTLSDVRQRRGRRLGRRCPVSEFTIREARIAGDATPLLLPGQEPGRPWTRHARPGSASTPASIYSGART
jgi:WD40 repeat protein